MAENQQHVQFIQRTANLSATGFEIFRQMEALANDAVDLGLLDQSNPLTPDDCVQARLVGLDIADIGTAVQGIAALGQLLNANDGALRKAFKRLAQFSAL